MTKPPDCTCGFPEVLARNGNGHGHGCPAYARWLREVEAAIAEGRRPDPESDPAQPPLDRGTAHWIYEDGNFASFAQFRWYQKCHEISVPIGWSLAPHEDNGVVLVNRFGKAMGAQAALFAAREGRDGFRIRRMIEN